MLWESVGRTLSCYTAVERRREYADEAGEGEEG